MQPLLWRIRQLCDHIHQPRSYAVSWKYSFRDRRREGRDHGAGCSGVYDGNDSDAAGVMREHAEKLGCPYYELKREDTEIHKITKDGIRFSLKDETYGDTVFDIPFIARYQVMNAALAVKTIQVLEDQIPVSLER